MKLQLPKQFMAAVLCSIAGGAVYAAEVTPKDGEIVNSKHEFMSAPNGNIFFDGTSTTEITENVTKSGNLYVREGELKFTTANTDGASTPTVRLGNLVVSGSDAVLTFDKANYTSSAALNHIGGVDGNGELNITDSVFNSDAEIFTIGVQGSSTGNGSNGTGYSGSYDNGFGRGDVNITNSSAKLTYRHLQIGQGSLNIDNSSVIVGNTNSTDEYYKGFKTTLGMGENTTSTINVTNGGKLEICASRNGNYLGGFSTNYSDGSTSNIIVDNGTFSVTDPESNNPEKYPMGREGNVYIGFSFMGDNKITPKNATTNIEVKNNGVASFDVYAIKLGYEGMSADNNTVRITVGESDNKSTGTLNLHANNINMHDGVTLDNYGKVNIDTTYTKDGEFDINNKYATNITNATVNNYESGTIELVNTLSIKGNSTVTNSGSIITKSTASEGITVTGNATLTNEGTIQSANWFNIEEAAQVTNSGTIDARVWLTDTSILTLEADSQLQKLLYVGYGSTLNIDGAVMLLGGLNTDYATDAEITFTLGSSIDVNGHDVTIGDTVTITMIMASLQDVENMELALFTNAGATNISDATLLLTDGTTTMEATFTDNANGTVTITDTKIIPEPTTATLSLLALAALAARRRRR